MERRCFGPMFLRGPRGIRKSGQSLNCHGPHAADSKECPKWKEEEAIQRYKAQHGGTFAQARAAIVVELDPNIKRRTYAKATSVGTKIAQTAPPKGSGRVNSTVKAQGAKSHKADSPVKKSTVTAESRSTVKPRPSPAPQRAPLATINRFTALTDIEEVTVERRGTGKKPAGLAGHPTDGLPGSKKVSLQKLIDQLPRPFVLLGDFNAHSPTWGDPKLDERGALVENLAQEIDLIILNHKKITFVHSAHHIKSAIDLAVTSASIALDYEWAVHSDLCGSDHFPIFLTFRGNDSTSDDPNVFNYSKADWNSAREHS
ncbi:hypothetical protein EGW08_015535 [Elysia chlorotica]|uniref:Endonuclease/exonuclease/phosphatase domain-containing protein n=1 Tax=Elysia chlorotica TaxID=188477 RepID=A0A433T592_ELYCH|nr:hypothetical protein EGW08_015535 [Elysia chlorotica]